MNICEVIKKIESLKKEISQIPVTDKKVWLFFRAYDKDFANSVTEAIKKLDCLLNDLTNISDQTNTILGQETCEKIINTLKDIEPWQLSDNYLKLTYVIIPYMADFLTYKDISLLTLKAISNFNYGKKELIFTL